MDVFEKMKEIKEISKDVVKYVRKSIKANMNIQYIGLKFRAEYEEFEGYKLIKVKIGKLLFKTGNNMYIVIGRSLEIKYIYESDTGIFYGEDLKNAQDDEYIKTKKATVITDVFNMLKTVLFGNSKKQKRRKYISKIQSTPTMVSSFEELNNINDVEEGKI